MDAQINYKVANDRDEAYQMALKEITPDYVAKFNIPCDISQDDSRKVIEASGKGFTLTINFTESSAQVSLKLSLMLKPFKGKVLEKIQSKLERTV